MTSPRTKGRAAAAAALLLVAALAAPGRASAAPGRPPALLSARALEEQHGLRVERVAVVAGGGMVDLRLRVVDEQKARAALAGHHPPRLRVEPSGVVLTASRDMVHELRPRAGRSVFLLFPNSGNAVQPGTRVSVVLGDRPVEPVASQ
jgi:hypothetical protein